MSNTYFVKERVNHDGVQYERGQEIILTGEYAEKLLASGVVQETPVEAEVAKEVSAPTEEAKATLDGGGTAPVETGEPSLDGNETKEGSEGTELTGKKDEGGILGRIFGGKKEEEAPVDTTVPTGTATDAPIVTDSSSTEPVKDPSVGL